MQQLQTAAGETSEGNPAAAAAMIVPFRCFVFRCVCATNAATDSY